MTRCLPTEIGYLTTLEALDVSQNFMNGSVPTELGRLSAEAQPVALQRLGAASHNGTVGLDAADLAG